MNHLKLLIILMLAAVLCGCSKKKNFIVQGEIDGIGSQTVVATYFSQGGIKRLTAGAADNKFAMRGEAPRPALLALSLSDGTPLATLVIENGDKVTVRGDLANPYDMKISGSSDSKDIADWVRENAEILQKRDASAINASLARWVGDHRSSKASTALMVTYFQTPGYEKMADSLMTLLSSSARAQDVVQNFTGVLAAQLGQAQTAEVPVLYLYEASDSVLSFNPHQFKAMLLAFTGENRSGRDTIDAQLRRLMKDYGSARRFVAVEISSASDSAAWRNSLSSDSANWHRTWAPATIASMSLRPLAVPRVPYFIVADSAGAQIYRGASITAAARAVEGKIK